MALKFFEGDILYYGQIGQTQIVRWNIFDNEQGFSINTEEWDREIIGNVYIKQITI